MTWRKGFSLKPYYETALGQLHNGDALKVLSGMESESFQCCVTSPPYWGLRDYGLPPMIWDSEPPAICEGGRDHVWGDELPEHHPGQVSQTKWANNTAVSDGQTSGSGNFCQLCGAWRGCLGLEPTPELYVKHMVEIFREVKRVLRDDGTLFLNLGDSYATHASKRSGQFGNEIKSGFDDVFTRKKPTANSIGLKEKDLCGIPWRVAFALQADGWYLRQDIIWHKPNPMPESVTDRCTKAHEYIFLLSKSQKYHYDADAIREPQSNNTHARYSKSVEFGDILPPVAKENSKEINRPGYDKWRQYTPKTFIGNRNKRSVWTVTTKPYPEAHFATFPPKLIEPCILAGTSEKGCCVECGSPWERVVEKGEPVLNAWSKKGAGHYSIKEKGWVETGLENGCTLKHSVPIKTTGWKPTCKCTGIPAPKPCVVLDPFMGAGTVGLVCEKLNRKWLGIELSEEYCRIAEKRIYPESSQLKWC